jgi:hypothetical protein
MTEETFEIKNKALTTISSLEDVIEFFSIQTEEFDNEVANLRFLISDLESELQKLR